MRRRRISLLGLMLVVAAIPLALRPLMVDDHVRRGENVWIDALAWDATHIVVAAERDPARGQVEVLYAWKGDLLPGEKIVVSDLAPFADPSLRAIRAEANGRTLPVAASGQRMLLFLRAVGTRPNRMWMVAGGVRSPRERLGAVGFVEAGVTFWFTENHRLYGASGLREGDAEIDAIVDARHVTATRERFERARETCDKAAPAQRAAAIAPFATCDVAPARDAAFALLAGCGDDGATALHAILRDRALLRFHHDALAWLARTRAPLSDEVLAAYLEQELEHWTRTAPSLAPGWANGHDELLLAYRALLVAAHARTTNPRVRSAARGLRKLHASLPPFADGTPSPLIGELDEMLKDEEGGG